MLGGNAGIVTLFQYQLNTEVGSFDNTILHLPHTNKQKMLSPEDDTKWSHQHTGSFRPCGLRSHWHWMGERRSQWLTWRNFVIPGDFFPFPSSEQYGTSVVFQCTMEWPNIRKPNHVEHPLAPLGGSLRLYPQAWIVWMNGSTWVVIDRLMALKRCWQCLWEVAGHWDKIPADQIKCSVSTQILPWPVHLLSPRQKSNKDKSERL